jgi:hypothetical protein
VLHGGGSLGRGSVDRLAQFLNCRQNAVAMEVQRGRGGASLGSGSLVAWHGMAELHRGGGTGGVESSCELDQQ